MSPSAAPSTCSHESHNEQPPHVDEPVAAGSNNEETPSFEEVPHHCHNSTATLVISDRIDAVCQDPDGHVCETNSKSPHDEEALLTANSSSSNERGNGSDNDPLQRTPANAPVLALPQDEESQQHLNDIRSGKKPSDSFTEVKAACALDPKVFLANYTQAFLSLPEELNQSPPPEERLPDSSGTLAASCVRAITSPQLSADQKAKMEENRLTALAKKKAAPSTFCAISTPVKHVTPPALSGALVTTGAQAYSASNISEQQIIRMQENQLRALAKQNTVPPTHLNNQASSKKPRHSTGGPVIGNPYISTSAGGNTSDAPVNAVTPAKRAVRFSCCLAFPLLQYFILTVHFACSASLVTHAISSILSQTSS